MFILLSNNSVQFNIHQALLGAASFDKHNLTLLKDCGILSGSPMFGGRKGDTERLSAWAKVRFSEQRLGHVLLLLGAFQWFLMNLKKKIQTVSMTCQVLPGLVASPSSQSNLLTFLLTENTLATWFPLSSSNSTTRLFPIP